jgi:hypothetical protein
MEFSSKDDLETFNRAMDDLLLCVAKLNRLCNEIDMNGLDLKPEDMSTIVDLPTLSLQYHAQLAMSMDIHSQERFNLVRDLLKAYSMFVENVAAALS